jgi:hypothetical protein
MRSSARGILWPIFIDVESFLAGEQEGFKAYVTQVDLKACASPKSKMRELGFAATTFRGWELA